MNPDVLRRPFSAAVVKQRKGVHGKVLNYVDVAAVIRRLNEGCDRWDFAVVEHRVLEREVVVLGRLVADGVTKMAFGGAALTVTSSGAVVSVADDLKAASSDALKKAASLLGVGLELYGGRERRIAEAHTAPSSAAQREASGHAPTARQLDAIEASARTRGLTQAALSQLMYRTLGKAELALLTRTEASRVISTLHSLPSAAH